MPDRPRGQPRPGAPRRGDNPPPALPARQERFVAALADYINLPKDDPNLPALAAMVEGMILPTLDVLSHGDGQVIIEFRKHWPARINRSKTDPHAFAAPPPDYQQRAF